MDHHISHVFMYYIETILWITHSIITAGRYNKYHSSWLDWLGSAPFLNKKVSMYVLQQSLVSR